LIWEGPNPSSISELIDNESKIQTSHWLSYNLLWEFDIWRLQVWKWRKYKAQTHKWINIKSLSWILTPFWIELYWAWGIWKCLVLQVQNGLICYSRLRNGYGRPVSIKQWLVAPSKISGNTLKYQEILRNTRKYKTKNMKN
jgi:hypothetical protein